MASTYTPIATTTLGSAASSITFSSIPSTYTDLKMVVVGKADTAGIQIQSLINGSSVSFYSYTTIYGDGTSALSNTNTGTSQWRWDGLLNTNPSAQWWFLTVDLFNYAGSTNKTALANLSYDKNGSGFTISTVGLWRQTTAISSFNIALSGGGNLIAGTTATLYGIKAA